MSQVIRRALVAGAVALCACAAPRTGSAPEGLVSVLVDNQRLERYTVRIDDRELVGWAQPLRITEFLVAPSEVEGRRILLCLLGPGSMRNACLRGRLSVPVGVAVIRVKALEAARVSRRRGETCHLDVLVLDEVGEIIAASRCP